MFHPYVKGNDLGRPCAVLNQRAVRGVAVCRAVDGSGDDKGLVARDGNGRGEQKQSTKHPR
eukprot:3505050-Rhodomonas_salina.1